MSKLNEIQQQMKDLQKKIKEDGDALFKEAVKEIFIKYPMVEALKWNQYTPSWNDGSPCTFRVNQDSTSCKLKDFEWSDVYGDEEGWIQYEPPAEAKAALDELSELIDNDEIMEVIFGTNVEIVVTREDITVGEYDCGY